jgi:cyclin-dependent kinase 12/13
VRLHKVGQGTYSSVYAVRDARSGAVRALKKVRLDTGDGDAIAFAAREVRCLSGASRPQ